MLSAQIYCHSEIDLNAPSCVFLKEAKGWNLVSIYTVVRQFFLETVE